MCHNDYGCLNVAILSATPLFPSSYSHNQAAVDNPAVFEDLGFTAGENGLLLDQCVQGNFFVDFTAEIMGTQVRCCSSFS